MKQNIFSKIYNYLKTGKATPLIIFSLAAGIITLPLFLKPGFIFLLDWPIEPFIKVESLTEIKELFFTSNWLVFFERFIAALIGFALTQKLLLLFLLLCLGLAGFKLGKLAIGENGSEFIAYFSGFLMICNPFVYERLMTGQINVAAGFLFFLLFFIYFKKFWDGFELERSFEVKKELKNLIFFAFFAGLSINISKHFIFLVALVLLVTVLVVILKDFSSWISKKKQNLFSKKIFKLILSLVGAVFIIFLVNFNFWLRADFKESLAIVNNFDYAHLEAFQTLALPQRPPWLAVLFLQGFWAENQQYFKPVGEAAPWFFAGFVLVMALSLMGFITLLKKEKEQNWQLILASVFVLAVILAIGIAGESSRHLNLWLYQNLWFYQGMREPQKWTALLLIIYGYWSSAGIKQIYILFKQKKKKTRVFENYNRILLSFLIVLPLILTPIMLNSFYEQAIPAEIPVEWYEMRSILKQKKQKKVLLLPWHQYLNLKFTKAKTVINPGKNFFGEKILVGTNLEFNEIYSQNDDPFSQDLKRVLEGKDQQGFLELMRLNEIKQVLILKEDDWQAYAFIFEGLDKGKSSKPINKKAMKILLENNNFIWIELS